jgi:hypothetical protein
MIFAGFGERSTKGSYRFRVISAFKSRENRSLAPEAAVGVAI